MIATRTITNHYQDFRLQDLGKLLRHDGHRGPFLWVQEGCDPSDPRLRNCSFVLTRQGTWLHYYLFMNLPDPVRRACAMFETSAEALTFAANLPETVQVETAQSLQDLIHRTGFAPAPNDPVGNALWEDLRSRHPLP